MARVGRKAAAVGMEVNGRAAVPERVYNAAVYVRLSVEDNRRAGDKESIAMQRYMLEKYIEGQPDMKLQGVYCDNGETGTDFGRPGFGRMMDEVRSRNVDCIVVKDLSRFGRNYIETGYYLEKIFPYLGVRFVAVNDGYDTLKDRDGLASSLKNLINDFYARDISRKTASALDTKRKNGEFIGAVPPYGYLKAPEDRHKLAVDPYAAAVVRRIFHMRAGGEGIAQIVRKLNEEGIPSPALYYHQKGYTGREPSEAGRLWQVPGVRRLLGNPVYAGHMAQGRTKKSLSSGIPRRNVSRDEWILVRDTHPPIVDQEIFDRVQGLMGERCRRSCAIGGELGTKAPNTEWMPAETGRGYKPETAENIFKGLLVCADCGRKMVRHKRVSTRGSAGYFFVCSIYEQNRGRRGCTKKYVREQDLQEAVCQFLRLQTEAASDMEKQLPPLQGQGGIRPQGKELKDRIDVVRRKIKRNTSLRSALYEALSDGALTKAEYLSLKAGYGQKARDMEGELEELLQKEREYKDRLSSRREGLAALRECQKEKAVTRKLALELIRFIRVSGYNELEIVWNFRDEFARLAETAVHGGGRGAS